MDSGFQLNEDTRSSMSCNEGDEQTEHDNETICSVHLNWFTDTELNHKAGAVKGVNDEHHLTQQQISLFAVTQQQISLSQCSNNQHPPFFFVLVFLFYFSQIFMVDLF